MKRSKLFTLIFSAAFVVLASTGVVLAQGETPAPRLPQTTRQRTQAQLAEEKERTDAQLLNLSIQELNVRLGILTSELKQFKTDLAEVTAMWRLMLLEQRQAAFEQQLAAVQKEIWDIENQEAGIRARLQTLDREFIPTGSAFITQDQVKRQIREQLQKQLQQLAARRPVVIEQQNQLRNDLNDLRAKMEEVKRELQAIERRRELEKEHSGESKEP
jgi:chromosome segregation ATPase